MKRLTIIFFVLIGLLTSAEGWGATETTKVKAARGAEVNVQIDVPTNVSGRRPAVVIAAGAGYHMDAPILKGLGERLAANGLLAFRFNWNYFSSTPQGQPSARLENEIQDMEAVVNLARSDDRVDGEKVIVIGKSLGSVVAYEVFAKDQKAVALVLLTPLCTYLENGKPMPAGPANYALVPTMEKPIVFALGSTDPACSVPMLYDFLKSTKGNVSTVVLGGNHSLELGAPSNPAFAQRNTANIDHAVAAVAHWVNLVFAR